MSGGSQPVDPVSAREELDRRLMVQSPVFTVADVEARTGIDGEVVTRLWRALGFAIPADDEPAFSEPDVEALVQLHTGISAGVMDEDTAVRLARALGQTTSRLAEWQVGTFATLVDQLEHTDQATGSRIATGVRIAEALGDSHDSVLVYAWKQHLAASIRRLEALGGLGGEAATPPAAPVGEPDAGALPDLHTAPLTVGFADLVSFSALSNQLDEDRIGDLVEIFETRATDVVTSLGGRVIKTLGDSVLFVTDDAVAGMDIAHGIIDVIGGDSRLPDVRLGLATGPVVLRFGDVFGPPVNLAARLTTIARRNRVITDDATAMRLPPDRFETRALTARPVRGFGEIEPIAVRRLTR